MFGASWPVHRLLSQKIRTRGPCQGVGETDALAGGGGWGRGSDGNLTNSEFSLCGAQSRRLAATRQHVATCHVLALQVLMRQKGLGLFWKTSWRRGKRLMDQPQHARPWPPKSLQRPSKGRSLGKRVGRLRRRRGG